MKSRERQRDTGAWSGANTLANCNKVEHEKIIKYIGKLTQGNFFWKTY